MRVQYLLEWLSPDGTQYRSSFNNGLELDNQIEYFLRAGANPKQIKVMVGVR